MPNYKSLCENSWSIIRISILAVILLINGSLGIASSVPNADRIATEITPQPVIHDSLQEINLQPLEQEDINWQVISSGGDMGGVSTNYILSGTVGQTAVESGSSTNYGLSGGFWPNSNIMTDDCSPGDANDDGQVNVGDAVYLIAYIFKGGPAPQPYETCNGDANCDCQANVGDAVYIIGYVFKGGSPPCSFGTWLDGCGPLTKK